MRRSKSISGLVFLLVFGIGAATVSACRGLVADYQSAISWASQTALRDVIGKTMLSDMLEGRDKISKELQKIIDERIEPWGIDVISVEVKDVLIPQALENAMSMQAQAERERQARVILGDSERQVAETMQPGGMAGLAALTMGIGRQKADLAKAAETVDRS